MIPTLKSNIRRCNIYPALCVKTKCDNAIKYNYSIFNENKNIVSTVSIYDFQIKNFDWLLMCDLQTTPKQRNKGYASRLISKAIDDFLNNSFCKGIYLFVKKNNGNAIYLYHKLGFEKLKTYKLQDGDYLIMINGNADISQFNNMQFS